MNRWSSPVMTLVAIEFSHIAPKPNPIKTLVVSFKGKIDNS
jgi:hypothetical protein